MRAHRRALWSTRTQSRIWLALTPIMLTWAVMGAQPAFGTTLGTGVVSSYILSGTKSGDYFETDTTRDCYWDSTGCVSNCNGDASVTSDTTFRSAPAARNAACHLELSGTIKEQYKEGIPLTVKELGERGVLPFWALLDATGTLTLSNRGFYEPHVIIDFSLSWTLRPCVSNGVYCTNFTTTGIERNSGDPVRIQGTIAVENLYDFPLITGSLGYVRIGNGS